MDTQLKRSSTDKMLAGVCGGLGQYLAVDSTIVRLIAVLVFIFSGFFPLVLVYAVLWLIMPADNTATAHLPAAQQQQPHLPATSTRQQDPTGEWKYDPYTGEPIQNQQQR